MSTPTTVLRRCAALTVLAAGLAVGAPAVAYADPPGDNGTVKIHSVGTPAGDHRNEPHVCLFYLDAFGFDGPQAVSWTINGIPPTDHDRQMARQGAITLVDGTGRTEVIRLPDGHYKLTWTFAGEHGQGKHKAFWVGCDSESPSPSASASAPAPPSESPSGGASTSPTAGTGGGGSVSPSPSNAAGSRLPVTGFPLTVLAVIAAGLIGAGVLLRLRMGRLLWWRR